MKKYKLISSTNQFLPVDMELPLDLHGISAGDTVQFLSEECICTQDASIITLVKQASETDIGNVYSLQEVIQDNVNVYPRKVNIDNISDLRINKEVDIFLETKKVMISPSDRITRGHGITVEALYRFLEKEWLSIQKISNVSFPLSLEENNNLVLWDEWSFSDGSAAFLKEGSWNRKIQLEDGRTKVI